MIIKEMTNEEILKAVKLIEKCWETDYKHFIPSGAYNLEKNYQEILSWTNDKEANDIRKMYGAFIGDEFVGFVGASFSETEDAEKGVEINYLFVEEKYRRKAIGIKLIGTIISEYPHYGIDELVVYSFRDSHSNKFYRFLNPDEIIELKQIYMNRTLLVDRFKWKIENIRKCINDLLAKRSFPKGGYAVEVSLDKDVIITSINQDGDYEAVCKRLIDYNVINTKGLLCRPYADINLYLKDNNEVIGAIFCDTFNYCLYIDVLWIHSDYRKKGFGKKLICEAEKIARANGCIFAHTSTFSYQSPYFYQACGYKVFAKIDKYPDNIIQYFLIKKL